MNKSDIVYQFIQAVVFLLPVGGLVWKAAKQSGKIEVIEQRQDKLEQQIQEVQKDFYSDIAEIKQSLTNLNVSIAEVKTALTYITKTIDQRSIEQ